MSVHSAAPEPGVKLNNCWITLLDAVALNISDYQLVEAHGAGCAALKPLEPGPPGPRERRARPDLDGLARALLDRAIALAGRPQIRTAPPEQGITGLDTFLWLADPPQPITAVATAGGIAAEAQAGPVSYVWDFGDGGGATTRGPGAPWRAPDRPGTIAHTYESAARYRLGVEVVWQARWRTQGGPWRPLGYFTTSAARPYPVAEVIPVLVPAGS